MGVAEEEIALVAGLFLGVGELGFSLPRSQRDSDFEANIIFVLAHRHQTALRPSAPYSLRRRFRDGESIHRSLSTAPACKDLPLLNGTPATLTQFDG